MSVNIVEKNAQALNQILRTDGKRLGKEWRQRVRSLLAEMFAALNAKPLDGALCLRLAEKIDFELDALADLRREEGDGDDECAPVAVAAPKPKKKKAAKKSAPEPSKPEDADDTAVTSAQKPLEEAQMREPDGVTDEPDAGRDVPDLDVPARKPKKKKASRLALADYAGASGGASDDACAPKEARESAPEGCMREAHSPADAPRIGFADSGDEAPCIGEADSGDPERDITAGEMIRQKATAPEEVGLFDLIRVQIRCFFKINACVRPPYIGNFVRFADKFSEVREERIERFIRVLSKGDEEISMKTEVEVGYREELIPDMPEMGFVLHPKKKKKR